MPGPARKRFVGLDFGTTNTALGTVDAAGVPTLAQFATAHGPTPTFRSIVFFEAEKLDAERKPAMIAGPRAIESYLACGGAGRLLQSLKSFLASPLFKSTSVFGTVYSLEELIAMLLRQLRAEAELQFGDLGRRAVLGRPVRFVNAEPDGSDEFPVGRLRAAAAMAGFDDVVLEFEPVAAAHFYEASLDHDELVLIADFGGGTSDFSLMRVGPGIRKRGRATTDMLGTEGVGVAGDAFDSQIVNHALAPSLGLGSFYQSYFDKKMIPVPPWIYERLRRWHHLSFLKSRETMHFLREIRAQTADPAMIDALIHVVDDDLGYYLYQTVEGAKFTLSSAASTRFAFSDPPVVLDKTIARSEFENWIEPETVAIASCLDRLLTRSGVKPRDVDRVFMTGGSSFVPAVRQLFASRFGEDKLSAGDELTSVASGLALRARELG